MVKQITIKDILIRNPHINEAEVERARETLRKLRGMRIIKTRRNELLPFGRRILIGEKDKVDSRTVYLGHFRR